MNSLSVIRLWMKWLSSQKKYIGLFFLFFGITLFTTMQYQLFWKPILYSMFMCGFLSGCFLIIGFIKYKKRYQAIYETYLNSEHSLQTLPYPADYMEENYQLLSEALFHSRYDVIESMKKKDTDDRDYYTRWIHQIKTPIAAMNLLLQAKEYENNKMIMRQELYKIEQYAQMALYYLRMQNMSSDLLLKEQNLYVIVKEEVKKYSASFIQKKLSLDFEEFSLKIISDEKWLGFVVEQILSNCIKYTNAGQIIIKCLKHTLIISDTGMGIREEDLPRIFEKGFTGYNGRMDKKSTGIGLFLCKQVMDNLGLEIKVSSVVGVGTTFSIDFEQLIARENEAVRD